MNILLVGSGGREHALAWRLAQSERCEALYCAPGNPGMEEFAECVPLSADNSDGLVAFAREARISLVVIGPEAPLVAGLADKLREAGIAVFGPSAAAARLEGSKAFMKDLCVANNVPTAAYGRFRTVAEANAFIDKHGAPIVVKADGLAAGKGVIIAQSVDEAKEAVAGMLTGGIFGAAGSEVVIEEFLVGEEVSFFAITDSQTIISLTSAQDHKPVGEGDTGPNTGGMGAYSPAPIVTEALGNRIEESIIKPIVRGMAAAGCPFTGVLFAGLMIVEGEPVVLEFNARFGDPETQALMMRMDGDVLEILYACAMGQLEDMKDRIFWREDTALCVVMAANGYPGAYESGSVIKGVRDADVLPDTKVFYAGTARDANGNLVSAGGRVLGVTALGGSVTEAQRKAYEAVDRIDWPGGFCRRDIGWRAAAREKKGGRSI